VGHARLNLIGAVDGAVRAPSAQPDRHGPRRRRGGPGSSSRWPGRRSRWPNPCSTARGPPCYL